MGSLRAAATRPGGYVTRHQFDITCPHCGQVIESVFMAFAHDEDEMDQDVQCPACEWMVAVHKDVCVTYTARKA